MLALKKRGEMKIGFGVWLKLSRGGMSQRLIAEELGVSVQTVGNWESGRSVPALNPDQTEKLCSLLETDLATLAKAFRGEVEIK